MLEATMVHSETDFSVIIAHLDVSIVGHTPITMSHLCEFPLPSI